MAYSDFWPRSLFVRDELDEPYRWKAPDGVVHALEGAFLVPSNPRTFMMWTRCGSADVDPSDAWTGDDALTCRACAAMEREDITIRRQPAGHDG
jgi:hypothetical protein